MKKIEYLELPDGREPFFEWFDRLDSIAQQRIDAYIKRISYGGSKNLIKSLKDGIFEIKVNVGPGYRVYFGEVGDVIILLLLGGDKKSQFKDIMTAKNYWRRYVQKR